MDTLRGLFGGRKPVDSDDYEPLTAEEATALEGSAVLQEETPFSWFEYGVFALLGMAMLWAWNMFLAAAPYFQARFQNSPWISQNFQSAILTVSTLTNLTSIIILTNRQSDASYTFRVGLAFVINTVIFTLLTASTVLFTQVAEPVYLAFLLIMVGTTAWATGLLQNGAFAFAAGFGRAEYTQALMAGQAVAGVLPPVAQIVSVLSVPAPEAGSAEAPAVTNNTSAFVYFSTAVVISVAALVAFLPLVRRHRHLVETRMVDHMAASIASIDEAERAARKTTSLTRLFEKLRWLSLAIFMCFAVSMFFPNFTIRIVSVRYPGESAAPRILHPEAFIPLAFFWWNAGDLAGRVAAAMPFSLAHRPAMLFGVSVARLVFLPLYLLCNIGGRGAIISSDLFYLFVVQFPFGLTNGWLASSCMMAAGDWVLEGEREAAGGFMGLALVGGLSAGSLLSFTVAGI